MFLLTWVGLLCYALQPVLASIAPNDLQARQGDREDRAGRRQMERLQRTYARNTRRSLPRQGTCNSANISVRKEWGALSLSERSSYISAVQCLYALPARTPRSVAPGVRTRWDDIVYAHFLNTRDIHFNAWLLPWHRHFVWTVEQTLREECGYAGSQPYWDWSKNIDAPLSANPIWDGSETSFGGNGTFSVANNSSCITDGPFKDWKVNLGPVQFFGFPLGPPNPREDGLGYNPRCIERFFNTTQLSAFVKYSDVANMIETSSNATQLLLNLEYGSEASGFIGVHGHPHVFISGTQADLFVSPSDPSFFVHHAMLDRVWSIWQAQDFEQRTYQLPFAQDLLEFVRSEFLGWKPSAVPSLQSQVRLTDEWPIVTFQDVMSPTRGHYCYMYE